MNDIDNQNYVFSLDTKLLVQFKAAGINLDEAILFFGNTIRNMLNYPPNYGPHLNNKKQKYDNPTWLMRGYYPDSYIYFRITMIKSPNNQRYTYVVKVISPTVHSKIKSFIFNSDEIGHVLDQHAEKILLGDAVKIDTVNINKINLPKCISPKGMDRMLPPCKK